MEISSSEVGAFDGLFHDVNGVLGFGGWVSEGSGRWLEVLGPGIRAECMWLRGRTAGFRA